MEDISIKICGLTNYEDAALAIECGADFIGFVFAVSPRRVDEKQVTDIIGKLTDSKLLEGIKTVGVFVNEDPDTIKGIVGTTGLDIIQFHGDETPEMINTITTPWYKALHIKSKDDVDNKIIQAGASWNCSSLLIDTAVKGVYGGTGISVAPDVACFARESVRNIGKKFILAGGINPENVAEFVKNVKPDGIDVSSGVEESKGKKSRSKMVALFKAIKEL